MLGELQNRLDTA